MIGALELVADKTTKARFAQHGKVGSYCADQCLREGLISRNLGDTIAFCPPLVITNDQVDEMYDRFAVALDRTTAWAFANSEFDG
jgi:4-aminobutyrate--pyruvate transaminase